MNTEIVFTEQHWNSNQVGGVTLFIMSLYKSRDNQNSKQYKMISKAQDNSFG